MVQTALGMMGQTYQPEMTVKTNQLESAMGKLRSTFGEYMEFSSEIPEYFQEVLDKLDDTENK